jgi:endonuclease YncB( thermonuclease family)
LIVIAAALLFGCAQPSETVTPGLPVPVVPQRQESPAGASILVAKVIRVIDGDTIVVADRTRRTYRIRLKAIDAPERTQAFATESTRSLVRLVSGKEVIVEWTKVDQRNGLVGRVFVDKRDISLQQIRAGMAWHSKQNEQSVGERELYDRYENEARFARR